MAPPPAATARPKAFMEPRSGPPHSATEAVRVSKKREKASNLLGLGAFQLR